MVEHHSDPGLLSVEVSDRFFKIIGFVCFGLLWLKESEHTRAAAKCRTRSSVRKRSVKACRSETSMLSAETERRVHGLPSSVLLIRWLSRVFFFFFFFFFFLLSSSTNSSFKSSRTRPGNSGRGGGGSALYSSPKHCHLLVLYRRSFSVQKHDNPGRKAIYTEGCFCPSQRLALF